MSENDPITTTQQHPTEAGRRNAAKLVLDGVLPVDKPVGMTSHDVVSRIRKLTGIRRVGHAGTLDPDATGVLLVCIGAATRLADLLADGSKKYRCGLAMGVTTSTEDASGNVLEIRSAAAVSERDLSAILPRFVGEILQIPPMVSAVHHEGKRLYQLAHQGITVERQARRITVHSLEMESFTPGDPAGAVLTIACGKGTYVRTLCADIGQTLGVGGHMAWLRRTAVGNTPIDDCIPLESLTRENVGTYVVSPGAAVSDLPRFEVSDGEAIDLAHGRAVHSVRVHEIEGQPGPVAAIDRDRNLVALGTVSDGAFHPEKVFAKLEQTNPSGGHQPTAEHSPGASNPS